MSCSAGPSLTRSRPVPDGVGDSLAEHADGIARAWAAALVRARPLERIGELPLDAIARDGADLCAAIARALQSDLALAELAAGRDADSGGASQPVALAALAGAGGPAELAADVEALRGVIWELLEPALTSAPGRTLAEAADRLAGACSAVLSAALAQWEPSRPRASSASPGAQAAPLVGSPADEQRGAGAAVIVDESPPRRDPARGGPVDPWPPRGAPASASRRGVAGRADSDSGQIVIRAANADGEGAAAWIRVLAGQLERHVDDGVPFGLLLAELLEPADPGRADAVSPAVERVLDSGGRARTARADAVVLRRERRGRGWLLVRGLDRAEVEDLARQLAQAAQGIRAPDGSPVVLAVGSASCPQDGSDAAGLAAHADVGLHAARAALRRRRAVGEPV
jgi:hypothetical protein